MLKCTDGEYYDMTDKKCNPGTGVNCASAKNRSVSRILTGEIKTQRALNALQLAPLASG